MNIKILLNGFFAIFMTSFPCITSAHENRVKIDLDSVGQVTVAKNRILGIARTARGPGYAAYILIIPNAQEKLAGVTRIVIMSNVSGRDKTHCRLVRNEINKIETSCSLALKRKDILAILTFDRVSGFDDFLPVLADSAMDLDKVVRADFKLSE